MKFRVLIVLVFGIFIGCSLQGQAKSDNIMSETDPFKLLGIPEFKVEEQSKKELPKLESIADLPRFVQTGQYNSAIGMKMLTKFLTEDDDELHDNGGVYDESGTDGLDAGDEQYPDGTEMKNRQRARSAATLWMRDHDKNNKYEAYGCTPDKEKVPGWLAYAVLMMNPTGDHKLVKVCIPEKDGVIVFGMDTTEKCLGREKFALEIEKKRQNYFKTGAFKGIKIPGLTQKRDEVYDEKSGIMMPADINPLVKQVADSIKTQADPKPVAKQQTPPQTNTQNSQADLIAQQIQKLQSQLQTLQTPPPVANTSAVTSPAPSQTSQVTPQPQVQSPAPQQTSTQPQPEVDHLKNEVGSLKDELGQIKSLLMNMNKPQPAAPAPVQKPAYVPSNRPKSNPSLVNDISAMLEKKIKSKQH